MEFIFSLQFNNFQNAESIESVWWLANFVGGFIIVNNMLEINFQKKVKEKKIM